MMFYRRDTFVIEIQTGKPAIRLEDACAPDHFDINKMAYITLLGKLHRLTFAHLPPLRVHSNVGLCRLLASNPDLAICPMEGIYTLRGAIGPPYLATRHKRNHNGKSHLGHGHHHHEGAESGNFGHKGYVRFVVATSGISQSISISMVTQTQFAELSERGAHGAGLLACQHSRPPSPQSTQRTQGSAGAAAGTGPGKGQQQRYERGICGHAESTRCSRLYSQLQCPAAALGGLYGGELDRRQSAVQRGW